jgi:TRAP transporter TAXI family solute receptor
MHLAAVGGDGLFGGAAFIRPEAPVSLRALAIAVAFAFAAPAGAQGLRLFTLGSGEVGGSYFAAADAICNLLNRDHRGVLRCSPEATPGSLYNIAALRDGQLDFAFVQSDWQRSAYEGRPPFAAAGPMDDLRSVMSLYPEAITVLARSDVGVTGLDDIRGLRVDVGPPASGRQATVGYLLGAAGLERADFAALLELPANTSVDELCAGHVDVSILVVGHPNPAVARAMQDCGPQIVPLSGPRIDPIFAGSGEYTSVVIRRSAYPGLAADVPTYAAIATVVTHASMDADLVEALVAATLDGLPELAVRAPVLAGLDPTAMSATGLAAPLHPGAAKAFEAHAARP